MVRDWLKKQKHISRRVNLEVLEFSGMTGRKAELCTVGNRYTWAYIYDDRVDFVTEIDVDDNNLVYREVVLTVHAHDPQFFKKIKQQLWHMLYCGNLNWPML